jgi:hypothetical protein
MAGSSSWPTAQTSAPNTNAWRVVRTPTGGLLCKVVS